KFFMFSFHLNHTKSTCLSELGSSGGFRETAQAFGVSKAWCFVSVNASVRVLCEMRSTPIKLPRNKKNGARSSLALAKIVASFCCGAIDGSSIAINRPRDFEGWYNRNGCTFDSFSALLLSICDHQKRFISFDNRPGSWSDAKIFQLSCFGRNIEKILPRGHHILADSGYGVASSVMTPFNFKLSSTRMAIEGALGLLKERFRLFKKPREERTPAASIHIIVACLVLHYIFSRLP
ncbi:DDE superfamily endonuclease, partial [Phytophthora infestans]